jgi:hypothetical protein
LVFVLQPEDRLGSPDWAPWSHQMLFDDYDLTAMALRGLNAKLGRLPGRADAPQLRSAEEYDVLLQEHPPLAPRYFLEYPHAPLLLFLLPYLPQMVPPVPPGLADGPHENIVTHRPVDDSQRDLWRRFRWVVRAYQCCMVLFLFGLILVLRAGYGPEGGLASSGLLLLLPAALYFSFHRFDIVPALLTALSLACLGRRRVAASAGFLMAGTLVKVYPVLLAPLVLRYLWPDRRAIWTWLAASVVTLLVLGLPPLLFSDWQGVWGPYRFQLTRGPEPLAAAGALPWLSPEQAVQAARVLRLGSIALTVGLLSFIPINDLETLLKRGAVVLLVFLWVSVFYSPQWVLWLMPLLLPLTGRLPGLVWLIVFFDLLSFSTHGVFDYNTPWAKSWGLWDVTLVVRTLLFVTLAFLLLRGRESSRSKALPG